MTVEIFNSSTTWVCPNGVTGVVVDCWGAGGGGGSDTAAGGGPGGGGGGGAYVRSTLSVVATSGYTVTVGTGGASVTEGQHSWFNTSGTIVAIGGKCGTADSTTPGVGGDTGSSIGQVKFAGGPGGTGVSASGG